MVSGAAAVTDATPALAKAWPSSSCARSLSTARRILRRGFANAARAVWRPYSQYAPAAWEEPSRRALAPPVLGSGLRFLLATLGYSNGGGIDRCAAKSGAS